VGRPSPKTCVLSFSPQRKVKRGQAAQVSTDFHSAEVAVITKSDLAAAADFEEAATKRNIQSVRQGMEVFRAFAKTGEGMAEYLEFVESRRARSRAAAAAGTI
jgi:Ni2+-binding GTPase involved in maturation of urease and hydrogenase